MAKLTLTFVKSKKKVLSLRSSFEKMQLKKSIIQLAFLFLTIIGGEMGVYAQKIAPIQGVLSVSGSFAELRPAHFHGGVDYRTGGVIGKPVSVIDDGYISRVSVSPTGYGKALYVNHPDGTMSVYAHLDAFDSKIAELVRREQYEQKSFKVDFVPSDTIWYKKGDVIAKTGNTGSSGGPHLHFEVRETETNVLLNPSHFVQVSDRIAPEIKGVYLYKVDMSGVESSSRRYSVQRDGNRYSAGQLSIDAGVFGVGVYAVDRMEGSTGRLGVYMLKLYADGDLVSSYLADSVAFSQNRLVDLLGDYAAYSRRETVYKTFGRDWGALLGCTADFDGYLGVEQDSVVSLRLELSDFNGNTSVLSFSVKGGKPKRASRNAVVWYANEYNDARMHECCVSLCEASLIRNVVVRPEYFADTVKQREVYTFVASEEPLLKAAKVKMIGEYDKRAVVCRLNSKGGVVPMRTNWYVDSLVSESDVLGRYTVAIDSVAPNVQMRNTSTTRVNFTISDAMTGVQDIQVLVNGEWTLYEYDPKKRALYVNRKEPAFNGVNDIVELRVVDVVGNSSQIVITI